MTIPVGHPGEAVLAFLDERHLATLTTLRPDGTPHVTPVGFTYDPEDQLARIITFAGSRKVTNIQTSTPARVAISQVDGGRWLTLEGEAEVTDDHRSVSEAVRRYTIRYRPPSERADRVAILVHVDRMMGRA